MAPSLTNIFHEIIGFHIIHVPGYIPMLADSRLDLQKSTKFRQDRTKIRQDSQQTCQEQTSHAKIDSQLAEILRHKICGRAAAYGRGGEGRWGGVHRSGVGGRRPRSTVTSPGGRALRWGAPFRQEPPPYHLFSESPRLRSHNSWLAPLAHGQNMPPALAEQPLPEKTEWGNVHFM